MHFKRDFGNDYLTLFFTFKLFNFFYSICDFSSGIYSTDYLMFIQLNASDAFLICMCIDGLYLKY